MTLGLAPRPRVNMDGGVGGCERRSRQPYARVDEAARTFTSSQPLISPSRNGPVDLL